MGNGFKLENFAAKSTESSTKAIPESSVEPSLVQSYEQGYKAGWDDATTAQNDANSRIVAGLAKNLERAVITTEEASAYMMTSLQPLLIDLVSKILPDVSQSVLAENIVDVLRPMIDEALDPSIQLVVHPKSRNQILHHVEENIPLPIEVLADEAIGADQVFLKVGISEKCIDVDEVLGELRASIASFFAAEKSGEVASNV